MSYTDYQQQCAFYGFTTTPLTEEEFDRALAAVGADEVYSVGLDVEAGFELETLIGEPVTT